MPSDLTSVTLDTLIASVRYGPEVDSRAAEAELRRRLTAPPPAGALHPLQAVKEHGMGAGWHIALTAGSVDMRCGKVITGSPVVETLTAQSHGREWCVACLAYTAAPPTLSAEERVETTAHVVSNDLVGLSDKDLVALVQRTQTGSVELRRLFDALCARVTDRPALASAYLLTVRHRNSLESQPPRPVPSPDAARAPVTPTPGSTQSSTQSGASSTQSEPEPATVEPAPVCGHARYEDGDYGCVGPAGHTGCHWDGNGGTWAPPASQPARPPAVTRTIRERVNERMIADKRPVDLNNIGEIAEHRVICLIDVLDEDEARRDADRRETR